MRRASARRRSVLGIAAGGVVLGHAITYVLVEPNAHQRTTDLAATGHAYLGLANDLGLIAGLIALSAVFLGGLTRSHGDAPPLRNLITRLAIFQAVAFAAMELLERLSAGAPLAGVLHHGILPMGIAIQVSIAVLGALIIRWLLRAADRVEWAVGAAPVVFDRASAVVVLPTFHVPARPALAAAGIRGPPLLASPR